MNLKRLGTSLIKAVTALAGVVAAVLPAAGQGQYAVAADSGSVRVSLITIYPGSNEWSIFGHTELRVEEGLAGDTWYNYGLFDFSTPGFAYRFACGETDYMCGAIPGYLAMSDYGSRKVVSQRLNLTQAEAEAVRDLLRQNALPANATYRYKFLSDNCSTRPRDIIEKVLGDKLRYTEPAQGEPAVTYRKMISHYATNYAWERMGIDIALGSSVDTAITWRQQMFIPMILMQACATATISRDGRDVPLVADTEVLNAGSDQGDVLPPTPLWLTPLALSIVLLLVVLMVTWSDQRERKVSRWFDAALSLVYALAGCLVAFLVLVSTHESTSPNWVLLWLHPLYIVATVALLLPRRWGGKVLRVFAVASAATLVASLAIGITGVQHFNAAFYPLILVALTREINYLVIDNRQRKLQPSCSATRK